MKKYALLAYIQRSLFDSRPGPWNKAPIIVKILKELGYTVDVIMWNDTKFKSNRRYDLFIGHGGVNWKYLCNTVVKSTAVKIMFSSGMYWKKQNQLEKERFSRLEERRGVKLPFDRLVTTSVDEGLLDADSIISVGGEQHKTYAKFPQVYSVNNVVPTDDHYDPSQKDFKGGRKHFLFFAGGGNIHKGLDLLVEAFSTLDLHLWCVTKIETRFKKVYAELLKASPNIHLHGFVKFRCKDYYQLMDKCNYVLSASCSEGQTGAVAGCMVQGLIPVITKGSSIDVGNFGVMFKNDSIEEITKIVKEISEYPVEWHIKCSKLSNQVGLKEYSQQSFYSKVKNAIIRTIETKKDSHE